MALGLGLVVVAWPGSDDRGFNGAGGPGTSPSSGLDANVRSHLPEPLRPVDPQEWKPDLVENFDTLDRSLWFVRDRASNANEDSYLLAGNVSVENGALRVQARDEAVGGRQWTSGYVDTNGRYAVPNYFRAEIRAKVPMQYGLWAAPLWFRPADLSGGEIDLIETFGREAARPLVHQTIHTDYGPTQRKSPRLSTFEALGDPRGTQWHIYTVEKVPGRITMWVDGVETAFWQSGEPPWFDQYYEAGKWWNLRINLQVGGRFARRPDATTDWAPDASAMFIDYVHTWTPR